VWIWQADLENLWSLSPAEALSIELQLVIGGRYTLWCTPFFALANAATSPFSTPLLLLIGGRFCAISATLSALLGCLSIPEQERSDAQRRLVADLTNKLLIICMANYPPAKEAHPVDLINMEDSDYASVTAGVTVASADLDDDDKVSAGYFVVADTSPVVPLQYDQVSIIACR
jgi:hypothetical protein